MAISRRSHGTQHGNGIDPAAVADDSFPQCEALALGPPSARYCETLRPVGVPGKKFRTVLLAVSRAAVSLFRGLFQERHRGDGGDKPEKKNSGFVFLTDGGHIDNLGIYELLRRRCRLIIVIDGEADPDLEYPSLVQVLRFARIDLNIRVRMNWKAVATRTREVSEKVQERADIQVRTSRSCRRHRLSSGRRQQGAADGSPHLHQGLPQR